MSKKTTDKFRHEKKMEMLKDRCVWEMRSGKDNKPHMSSEEARYTTNGHKRAQFQPNTHKTYSGDNRQLHNKKKHFDSSAINVNIGEGEFVLFDDIEANWSANMRSRRQKQQQYNEFTQQQKPLYQQQLKHQHHQDMLKMTKMIGQMPIAEYEGSPRRFGNQPMSTSATTTTMLSKRAPGFPQRVSPKMDNHLLQQVSGRQQQTAAAGAVVGNLIDIDDDNCIGAVGGHLNADNIDEFFQPNNELHERYRYKNNTDSMHGFYHSYRNYDQDCVEEKHGEEYIGQRLAQLPQQSELYLVHQSPMKQPPDLNVAHEQYFGGLYIDSLSRSSVDFADTELEANLQQYPRNFTLSPETTDYDSNCGDLDSLSNDINLNCVMNANQVHENAMSSGHASDNDMNALEDIYPTHNIKQQQNQATIMDNDYCVVNVTEGSSGPVNDLVLEVKSDFDDKQLNQKNEDFMNINNVEKSVEKCDTFADNIPMNQLTLKEPETARQTEGAVESMEIAQAMKEIRSALQRVKQQTDDVKTKEELMTESAVSPVWIRRKQQQKSQQKSKNNSNIENKENINFAEEEAEADTDDETDRLLGQQLDDEQQFFEDKIWSKPGSHAGSTDFSPPTSDLTIHTNTNSFHSKPQMLNSATIRHGLGTTLTHLSPERRQATEVVEKMQYNRSPTSSPKSIKETLNQNKRKARNKEDYLDPAVLIEGVLFRARYLGSTQLVCEGQPTKSTRMMQAEEAVSRIKAPDGESQPSTEVDLFISTEKIMVLNTDLKEIMMDHSLRTISYIADIGDLVVLMARRRFMSTDAGNEQDKKEHSCSSTESNKSCNGNRNRTPKMICHVFESDEAQFIAQSIGQAFQVAYMEFLKANGIEDHSFVKEMDYQEVLNSQEIFGDELQIFAKKELQKEVVVPKAKGEILGVVIVESGWGSMLPTVVIANLMSTGAAARCGQLNIGDQLIAINGLSLVGLPLSTCQNYIRNAKNQTAVKFTVVPCPPVVEVKIKRPNTKYQLGFSVQNGVICSLLRGGIAERGGVRVGHRIIEINNQSVVAVPHEKIVNMLATSVGEILMKTMPTSMFRLLTGQETPIYI